MSRDEVLYLIPYLASLLLSAGILVYSWMHRRVRGASAYTIFMGGQTLSDFGFIMKLVMSSLEGKILWDKFLWVIQGTVIIVGFVAFAIEFSESKIKNPPLFWTILLAIPATFNVLVLTDSLHHLIYPDPVVIAGFPFSDLQYSFTPVVYIFALYIYVATFYGIGLLIRRALRPHNLHGEQFVITAIGFLIPIALSILSLFNIRITPQRDATPFTFAIGNLIVAWGLFRYRVFDIIPIARDTIFENINDPMAVLDLQGRIEDINPAMLKVLGLKASNAIRMPYQRVFSAWPHMVELLSAASEARTEATIQAKETERYYEVVISPLQEKNNSSIGRVIITRDVTEHRNMDEAMRRLNEELEERIASRTEELRRSAEQYRAVVDNQSELIVRWKPDRTRTFVNDAYCRYFGFTPEQAMQTDFLSLIVDEDRRAVEEKISRLISGNHNSETDTHRVIRPDKSIGWQEWTDRAIRDRHGKIVEFQSVGRDITDRKNAENALRQSEEKYAKAFKASPDAIILAEFESGRLVEINDGFENLFGYHRDEVIGRTALGLSLFVNSKERERFITILRDHGRMQNEEFEVNTKYGDQRIVQVNADLIAINGITHIVSINRDITEQKRAANSLRQSEERFSKAFLSSPVIITIFQVASGRILDVNEAFERTSGVRREEVIGKTATELGFWSQSARDQVISKLIIDGTLRNEPIQFQTSTGDKLTCLCSAELIELANEKCAIATLEDVTEKIKAEERILRLNRLYVTISQINQTLVHTNEKEKLLNEICRVAVEHGRFRMAWIGLIEAEDNVIHPKVFDGAEMGYLKNVTIDYRDQVLGNGPTGRAVREQHCIICQDIANDPSMLPWREAAVSRGYRSSAAVPLREQGKVIGALTVYAGEANGFDSEDEELLEQIGQDVSFALDSINAEAERKRAEDELAKAYDTTLEGWAKALEFRDKETEGHSRRVTEMTVKLAREWGVSEDERTQIYRGALLHDIGKMGIPDDILRKADKLDEQEWKIIRQHPLFAYELLSPIPYLKRALDIPYCHHEKWDGTGYPRGLKGEEIPLAARIFAIADVWDAIRSDRPYKTRWPHNQALKYIKEQSGSHFDPKLVDLFINLIEQGKI